METICAGIRINDYRRGEFKVSSKPYRYVTYTIQTACRKDLMNAKIPRCQDEKEKTMSALHPPSPSPGILASWRSFILLFFLSSGCAAAQTKPVDRAKAESGPASNVDQV